MSGVRSSWLMLARNCDLCWLATSSWWLFSWISVNSRTFSMAITAWAAKASSSSIWRGVKAPGSGLRSRMPPIAHVLRAASAPPAARLTLCLVHSACASVVFDGSSASCPAGGWCDRRRWTWPEGRAAGRVGARRPSVEARASPSCARVQTSSSPSRSAIMRVLGAAEPQAALATASSTAARRSATGR